MSTEGTPAKRIACVGKDDERYVDRLVRGLELRGLTARHISLPALRMAPRAPDLTVLIGNAAEDGGAAVLTTLGAERGPYAAVMPSGALAARLEARQRGLHVVPRKDDGAETAALIAKLLVDLAAGAPPKPASMPAPPQQQIAVDGLEWDDDEPETVNKPQAVKWRPGAARGVSKPAPPPPKGSLPGRTTLPGGVSFPPPAKPLAEVASAPLTFDDVTVTDGKTGSPDVHQAVTKPQVLLPSAEDEAKRRSEPPSEDTLDDSSGALALALGMNTVPSGSMAIDPSADPDVTSPQAALAPPEEEAAEVDPDPSGLAALSPDVTAKQAAIDDAAVRDVEEVPPDEDDEPEPEREGSRPPPLPWQQPWAQPSGAHAIAPPPLPPPPSTPEIPPAGAMMPAPLAAEPASSYASAPQPAGSYAPAPQPAAFPSAPLPVAATAPAAPRRKSSVLLAVGIALGSLVALGVIGAGGAFLFFFRATAGVDEAPAIATSAPSPSAPAVSAAVPVDPIAQPAPIAAPADPVAQPAEPAQVAEAAIVEPGAPHAEPAPVAEAAIVEPAAAAAQPSAPPVAPPEPPPTAPVAQPTPPPVQPGGDADALVSEGESALRAQRYDDARAAFTRAVAIDDENASAHAGLAEVAIATNDSATALTHADRVVHLRRLRSSSHVLLGDARRAAGDRGGARRAYQRALSIDPEDEDAQARLDEL